MSPRYLSFLYNLGQFNIKLGLRTIGTMMEKLDNPHHHPRIIHFAGTNGKGSTLATLENLILKSGYSVGSTISPHLVSFNERFRINGVPVEDAELDAAFETVCQAIDIKPDLSQAGSVDGTINPTFFEFSMAMAFVIFRARCVDYILLETGLGGRLDATNVITHPLACVLTRIAYDHQEFLGDTLEAIAAEKLGILKPGSPVFVSNQESNVLQQIRTYCSQIGVTCFFNPQHFGSRVLDTGSGMTEYFVGSGLHATDDVGLKEHRVRLVNPGLIGDHQRENMATALAVYFAVVPKEKWLSEQQIAQALGKLKWRGRLDYLDEKKQILIDGAHNASGVESLIAYLQEAHPHDRILFAISWKKRKELLSVLKDGFLDAVRFLPIKMASESGEDIEVISAALKKQGHHVYPAIPVSTLIENMQTGRLPDHDLLVIAGSLYLVGEFLEKWDLSQPNVGKQ